MQFPHLNAKRGTNGLPPVLWLLGGKTGAIVALVPITSLILARANPLQFIPNPPPLLHNSMNQVKCTISSIINSFFAVERLLGTTYMFYIKVYLLNAEAPISHHRATVVAITIVVPPGTPASIYNPPNQALTNPCRWS